MSSSASRSNERRRSASVPSRYFMFIVTNHPDFRQLSPSSLPATRRNSREPLIGALPPIQRALSNDRERILRNLLRVELRDAAYSYLSRTHESASIEYVFFVPDIRSD